MIRDFKLGFLLALLFLLFGEGVMWGANLYVMSENWNAIELGYLGGEPKIEELGGKYIRLSLDGGVPSDMIGYPELPVIRTLVEIPYGASYVVEVVEPVYKEIQVEGIVYPRQPPRRKESNYTIVDEVKNEWFYASGGVMFNSPVEVKSEGWIRAYRVILLEFRPINYDIGRGELRIITSATIRINLIGGDTRLSKENKAKYVSPEFDKILDGYLIEPVFLRPEWFPPLQIGYYIIGPSSYTSLLTDFIKWKRRKGYKVVVKSPSELGGTASSIKSYLQTAYNNANPSPTFILLVGDVADVPTFTGPSSTPASDLPYTLLSGSDYLPDAMIGRLSVSSASQLQGLVNKILEHEKYLFPSSGWLARACFIATDDATYWPVAEGTHRYVIRRWLGPIGMSCDSIWGHSGGSTSDVINAINNGRAIVNYSGHGTTTSWVGPALSQANIRSLTNSDMYPFVISNACQTNTFSNSECFGETWIRNDNKAALAFWGASNYTYWEEDDTLERRVFDSIFQAKYYIIGGMTQRGLYGVYTAIPSNAEYYYYMYNILGDPSIALWIKQPSTLSVTHPSVARAGADTLTISVSSGGSPVDSALVCVTNDSTVHQVAYTTTSGVVRIPVTAQAGDTLRITVTAYNMVPYQGYIVVGASGPYLVYGSNAISDDNIGSSSGDGDTRADAGERIELTVSIMNVGTQQAQGVNGVLSSTSPYISVISGGSSYGNIPVGAIAQNSTYFVIQLSPSIPNGYNIPLQLTLRDSRDSVWVVNFTITAYAPVMSVSANSVTDPPPGGDNDNFIEPNEIATISIGVRNSGGETAKNVQGSIVPLSAYLAIVDGVSSFGNIMQDSVRYGSPSFTVRVDPTVPTPSNHSVELTLTNSIGQVVKDTITFMIGSGGFFDDVESGSGGWSPTNWHITEWRSNSPTHSWYLGRELFHTYTNSTTFTLVSPSFILPPNSYLTFWHLYATEIGYDTCYVHIKYGSSSWIRLDAFNGMSRVFRFAYYDLSSIPAGSDCQIRFSLVSDQRVRNEGWFIDDIYVGPANDGELGAGDVYPPAGDVSTSYKFRVTYASIRSNEATEVKVFVDGVPYELTYESGTLTTGKVYSRYISLSEGVHRYYFVALVNGREIRFPKSTDKIGPYVGQPILVYDFGTSSSGFSTSGTRNDWQYGSPSSVGPTSVPFGTNCWATRISANYRDSSASRLISPEIDLSNIYSPYLRILHWYSFQSTDNLIGHDGGNVKALLPGDTLVLLYPPRNYDGQISSYNLWVPYEQGFIDNDSGNFWHYDIFDLSHLVGRRVRFYFDFGSSSRNNDAGWYINRIELFGMTSTGASEPLPGVAYTPRIEIYPPHPNPFNRGTNFVIYANEGENYNITVYNILGAKIWETKGKTGFGSTIVSWKPEGVSSGIYLYHVECSLKVLAGKVILLR